MKGNNDTYANDIGDFQASLFFILIDAMSRFPQAICTVACVNSAWLLVKL